MTGRTLVGQPGFARLHPGAVAEQRVDLAVVGQQAERLGQLPGREGVGRVALVVDGERRSRSRDRAGRGRRPAAGARRTGPCRPGCGWTARRRRSRSAYRPSRSARALDVLAGQVQRAVRTRRRRAGVAGHDQRLANARQRRARGRAELIGVDRHVAPAEQAQARARAARASTTARSRRRVGWRQEEHAHAEQVGVVETAEAEALGLAGEQPARDLGQHARTVAALAVGGDRAAVAQVGDRLDGLGDDVVAGLPAQARDEARRRRRRARSAGRTARGS